MKVLSFLGAVGLGIFSGAWIIAARRRRAVSRSTSNGSMININEASQQEIMQGLSLDADWQSGLWSTGLIPARLICLVAW